MIRVYMPTFVIKERAGSRKEVEARSFSEATGLAVDKFVSYKRVFLPGEAAGGNNLVKVREQSKQNGQCMVWHGHLVLPPSESKYPPTPPRVSLSERRHVIPPRSSKAKVRLRFPNEGRINSYEEFAEVFIPYQLGVEVEKSSTQVPRAEERNLGLKVDRKMQEQGGVESQQQKKMLHLYNLSMPSVR
ncbi:hypothetical protein B296_00003320 [Ensete ventricosum]|uniref:Uncharacterized protein n=1 Tax=Ensete ventricosum TaxID=4639 RepID=A0A426YJD2_ENSVE|nr:hypothetical protein B296_00003320 [Ensete ventricosum]